MHFKSFFIDEVDLPIEENEDDEPLAKESECA